MNTERTEQVEQSTAQTQPNEEAVLSALAAYLVAQFKHANESLDPVDFALEGTDIGPITVTLSKREKIGLLTRLKDAEGDLKKLKGDLKDRNQHRVLKEKMELREKLRVITRERDAYSQALNQIFEREAAQANALREKHKLTSDGLDIASQLSNELTDARQNTLQTVISALKSIRSQVDTADIPASGVEVIDEVIAAVEAIPSEA